jgi:hypothetical protein
MLCMRDAVTTTAATAEEMRRRAAARWGPQRPVKLARELASRIDELPELERLRLRQALDEPAETAQVLSEFRNGS